VASTHSTRSAHWPGRSRSRRSLAVAELADLNGRIRSNANGGTKPHCSDSTSSNSRVQARSRLRSRGPALLPAHAHGTVGAVRLYKKAPLAPGFRWAVEDSNLRPWD
jgi:hypothetical protein